MILSTSDRNMRHEMDGQFSVASAVILHRHCVEPIYVPDDPSTKSMGVSCG